MGIRIYKEWLYVTGDSATYFVAVEVSPWMPRVKIWSYPLKWLSRFERQVGPKKKSSRVEFLTAPTLARSLC